MNPPHGHQTRNHAAIRAFVGTKRQLLTAVEFLGYQPKSTNQYWRFSCECGGYKDMTKNNFTKSCTNNCGCRHGQTKHGMAYQNHSKRRGMYNSWVNMRARCNNPNLPDYRYYGGRGIKHCERWNDFANFLEDMEAAYQVHKLSNTSTTLDRRDVDGDYTPENCRWATRKEQSVNRRPWVQNGKLTHVQ